MPHRKYRGIKVFGARSIPHRGQLKTGPFGLSGFLLPVVLWDERRTTIDAHNILFNSGKNAKQRKKVVDAVAASLILEGYLTFKKSH